MTRRTLAFCAGLVVAALLGLYALLGTDDRPDDRPIDRASPVPVDRTASSGIPAGKPRKMTDPAAARNPSPAVDHTVGETRIRDHRTGEHEAAEPPPPQPAQPPEGRRIATQITGDLGEQIRPVLRDCTASLAPGARSDKSRVEGQITISIKDHQATVTAAAFQPRDIAEAAQRDLTQCLVQRAMGLTASAGNEADLVSYTITVSLALP